MPIKNVNPPTFHFMFGGGATMQPIYWQQGTAYFMNTHKPHCLFNNSFKEKRARWKETLIKDIQLNEAINILSDIVQKQKAPILASSR